VDVFRVALAVRVRVRIETGLLGLADSLLYLVDANGRQLAMNDDFGGRLSSRIEFTPTASATFYLRVRAYGDASTGGYWVRAVQATGIWDSGFDEAVDFIDARNTATAANPGGICYGMTELARQYYLLRAPGVQPLSAVPGADAQAAADRLHSDTGLINGLQGLWLRLLEPSHAITVAQVKSSLARGVPVNLLMQDTHASWWRPPGHSILAIRAVDTATGTRIYVYNPNDRDRDLDDFVEYDARTVRLRDYVHDGYSWNNFMTAANAGVDFGPARVTLAGPAADRARQIADWLIQQFSVP